jgi:hypothetical protein
MTRTPNKLTAAHENLRLVIEHDPAVGWYLYVYQGGECTHDFLQDTLELAVEQAESDFGVSRSAWRPSGPA